MRTFSPASMISTMLALSLTLPVAQAAPAQTNTSLAATPTGTQPSGTVVTLTATVAQGAGPGGAAVPAGTVKFCEGTADLGKCNGRQLLGMAQLDPTGKAVWKVRPPLGTTDTYYALFLPTSVYAGSASTAATLSANEGQTTTTMLAPQGTAGNYTVSARVDGIGSRAGPTGNVSFQDGSNGFVSIATAALGAASTPVVTLEEPAVYSTYNTHTMAAAVADFNKDGLPDMALASNGLSNNNAIMIYLGQPDGTMKQGSQQPIVVSNIAYDISGIAVGDFKNSGNLDLAVTLNYSQQIVVVGGNGDGTFVTPVSSGIATEGSAQTLAVGDFDGDGKLDIAVGNQATPIDANQVTPGSLVVMKGDGLLGFTAGTPSTAIFNPSKMAVADLNKDGVLDLAVAELPNPTATDNPPGKLTALIGKGDGTFTTGAGTNTAGVGPSGLVVDDFNNDGLPDVLIANGGSSIATLFLGVVATPGTFTPQSLPNMAPQTATAPASADFDRDGNADVAMVDAVANVVTVLLGSGTGTFTPLAQGPQALGGTPAAVATADFNGDGVPDLLAVNSADNNASIVPVILTTSATASKGSVSVIGNNDQHNIVASYGGNSLYLGSLSTNFNALTAQKVTTALNLDPLQPDTAMQGENVTFIAEVTPAQTQGFAPGGNVTFTANPGAHLLGNAPLANGTASVTVPVNLSAAAYTVVANYAGDTNFAAAPASNGEPLNIILPPPPTTTTLSFTNTGTNSLATLTAKVTDNVSSQPVTAGTVNFCAVLASYCTGADLIGSAQLDPTGTAKLDTYLVGQATNWFRADFLGTVNKLASNSVPEAAPEVDAARYPTTTAMTPAPTGSAGSWKLNATVTSTGGTDPQGDVQFLDHGNNDFLLGTATLGTPSAPVFDFAAEIPVSLAGAQPSSIAVGDLDSDHHLDLAVTNPAGGTVTLLKGAGNGNFTAFPTAALTLAGAHYVVSADFNNDGMLDLMVAESGGNKKVMPYQGAGTGTFTAKTEQSTGNTPYALAVADFNGDGLLDIAVVSNTDNNVAVLLNQNNFTFAAASGSPYALGAGAGPQSVTAGDLDGDGFPDLAVANTGGKSISILKGKGGGSFNAATTQPMSPVHEPRAITLGDFDGNGHLDLATANGDATVSVFLGQGHLAFPQADTAVTNAGQTNVIVAGDFDGDGKEDLAVSDGTKNVLTVLLGQGDGTFPPAGQKSSTAGTTGGGFVAVGDFDETGQLDAVMANPATTGARLIRPTVTTTATAELDNVAVAGTGTPHPITASYLGNAHYLPSTAGTTNLPTVIPAPLASSVALYNPSRIQSARQPTNLTAQITATPSTQGHTFTGRVQFKNVTTGHDLGGPVLVTPTGVASYTTSPGDLQPLVSNSLQAVYTGDANFAAGTGTSSIYVSGSFAPEAGPEMGTTPPQTVPSARPRSGTGAPQPRVRNGAKVQKTKIQR